MRKTAILSLFLLVFTTLPACSPSEDDPLIIPPQEESSGQDSIITPNDSDSISTGTGNQPQDSIPEDNTPQDSIPGDSTGNITNDENQTNQEEKPENMESNQIRLTVNGRSFTATLEQNSSAEALKELLKDGDLSIRMDDYGDMEKVGSLGTSLPRNDRQITTRPGDMILYLGNSFTIYYDTNTWNFTRLGKLDGVSTREEVLNLLGGKGEVTVTLSLK